MKVWLKNNKWYLLLFVIVFIILIPLGINIAFKQKTSVELLSAEWDANAALGFYAALLASLITVYGVFLSIQYAQKNYREDIKNRVLPYIAVTHYKSKSKINLFELIQNEPVTEEKNYYKEYKVERIFFIINDENIEVKESLTQQQDNLLKKGGFLWKQTAEGFALLNASFISCPLEIENVGNGAAINFRVGFNRVNQKRLYVTPLQLKQNETLYIHIFSDSVTNNTLGDYELEFFYEDIYGTKYTQKYKLSVAKEKETDRTYNSIDFSGKQIEYKEEQTNE